VTEPSDATVPRARRLPIPRRPATLLVVAIPLVALLVGAATAAPAMPAAHVLGAAASPTLEDAAPTTSALPAPPVEPDRLAAAPGQLGARHRRLAPVPPEELTGYVWPLRHARLTLPFGPTDWGSRLVEGRLFHDAIDIATSCGDRVVAAHAGTVLAAGRHYDAFMGWLGDLTAYQRRLDEKKLWSTLPIVLVIDDGNGYRSIYAHFSRVVVKVGQEVRAGQLIGYEGMTGRATGCHLHYGLFSPLETTTFGLEPGVVRRMLLPPLMIARVDPLRVLPSLASGDIRD
jgi:murein DD-endopeptidase MepM/ murein hydrolase activator NlpD